MKQENNNNKSYLLLSYERLVFEHTDSDLSIVEGLFRRHFCESKDTFKIDSKKVEIILDGESYRFDEHGGLYWVE